MVFNRAKIWISFSSTNMNTIDINSAKLFFPKSSSLFKSILLFQLHSSSPSEQYHLVYQKLKYNSKQQPS